MDVHNMLLFAMHDMCHLLTVCALNMFSMPATNLIMCCYFSWLALL